MSKLPSLVLFLAATVHAEALTVRDGSDDASSDRPTVERGTLPAIGDAIAPGRPDAAEPTDAETGEPNPPAGDRAVGDEHAEPNVGPEADDALEPRFDFTALPTPVARMREALLEAAVSGDLDAVGRLAGTGADATEFAFDTLEGTPADMLRELSGDEEGHEILAILSDILEAGYVVVDEGTEDALYLWPHFAATPLETLEPAQRVQLFRIMTAGDLEESLEFGSYVFYRTGIDADGRWRFFLSGD